MHPAKTDILVNKVMSMFTNKFSFLYNRLKNKTCFLLILSSNFLVSLAQKRDLSCFYHSHPHFFLHWAFSSWTILWIFSYPHQLYCILFRQGNQRQCIHCCPHNLCLNACSDEPGRDSKIWTFFVLC